MYKLTTPIQYVKGVGPKRAETLNRNQIFTVEDFLSYKPFRYEDRTNFKRIAALREGEHAVIYGQILEAGVYVTPRAGVQIFEMMVRDASGSINVKFFNQPYLKNTLRRGLKVIIYGQVRYDAYRFPSLCIINPEYEVFDEGKDSLIHTGRVVPVYRKLGPINTKGLRSIAFTILQDLDEVFDTIPEYIRRKYGLISRREALVKLHFPEFDGGDDLARAKALAAYNAGDSPAHRRMVFEELFELQVGLDYLRRRRAQEFKGRTYVINDRVREAVKRILPFHPTAAQKRALKEIVDDLISPRPMNRLLQGDVGCGKTIVALQAMVIAIENGYQAALMAPTEILAEQHYFSIKRLLGLSGYGVALLTSGVRRKEKEQIKGDIARGDIDLVVGTHAIIEEDVKFRNLGLVVIDEQHRFGVIQRSHLIGKGYNPDTLVMTATPIPRSLALTVYGDLDLSIIDELPPGRKPIRTILRTERDRDEVYSIISREVEKGHQAYIVYPIIEESEKLDLKAAVQMAEHLANEVFPRYRIGLLHGRMRSQEKEEVMARFASGEIQILVSTTVIEVGVDVPNATVMVIEHAERFGLAQLHQLRGRVGRGSSDSVCVLVADLAQGGFNLDDARRRLEIMCQTNDGFKIAEVDLELRGPGELTGTKQSGLPDFKFANIVRDRRVLEVARAEAVSFLDRAASSKDPELGAILQHIQANWKHKFGLALVG